MTGAGVSVGLGVGVGVIVGDGDGDVTARSSSSSFLSLSVRLEREFTRLIASFVLAAVMRSAYSLGTPPNSSFKAFIIRLFLFT